MTKTIKDNKKVIKRDGRVEMFNRDKIFNSILSAFNISDKKDEEMLQNIQELVSDVIEILDYCPEDKLSVEVIQDTIEDILRTSTLDDIAKRYNDYRTERTKLRTSKSNLMKTVGQIGICTDRDNGNVGNNYSSKLLRIASETNKVYNLAMMNKDLAKLHETGDLYYHDLDSFNLTINCLHIPTKEILLRGFNTGYGTLRQPKRLSSAADLSCILLQSTQNDMFGGQSHPDFDNDMACFVDMSRNEIRQLVKSISENSTEDYINKKTEELLRKDVAQAMQTVVFNLNSMHARAGSQVPFSSINIGIPTGKTERERKDAALICEELLIQYEKGFGRGEQFIFPNIIFRVKDGVNKKPQDPYYYLFKLACRVASKRMNPTFMNIDCDFNKEYYDKGYMPSEMGCRTYLMSNCNGEPGTKGRGNIAPTTINLPRIGILANHNIETFFELLDIKINEAVKSLMYRYDVLKKLKVSDLPFVAGQGILKGSENLNEDDSIEPILKQGTYGIGFIGLAETLVALTGKHHGEDNESKELGYKIIRYMREKCDKTTKLLGLNFSCYATPAEGLSGKFIAIDKKRFGIIKGVTDKEYYTNSFHIPVGYPISIMDKIEIEAPFHKLCNGGHITYVELDGYPTEKEVEDIVTCAYTTNINYIGINFHIKYCKDCGEMLNQNVSECCKCGSKRIQGVSRITGYLALDERFGNGKYYERKDRVSHKDNEILVYDDIK